MHTLQKTKWQACLVLLSLLLPWGCRVEQESALSPIPQPITVSEAQAWYEKKGSSQARSANDANDNNRMAYWKYAVSTQLANGTPVVTVPLMYGYSSPVTIAKGDYTLRPGQPALATSDRSDVSIQKKLLIAKDAQGNYIFNVMVILPTKAYRSANKKVRKENFDGLLQIYDESETTYLLGLEYKNGRLVNVIRADAAGGRAANARMRENCYRGIYQQNPPAQVGGSSMTRSQSLADQYGMPMAIDFGGYPSGEGGGGDWYLTDVQEVDCSTYTPTTRPVYNPTTEDGEWVISKTGTGGGVPGSGGNDPNGPQPIDEGSPDDLQPTDRFFYDMQHRSRGAITFTNEEIDLITNNADLIPNIRNYIDLYNAKPDIVNFFNNYIVTGPDVRITNLKQRLNCFGSVNDSGDFTYKVTLYVDQPVANSRQTVRYGGERYRKVGHTFVGLEKRSATGETVLLVLGFYVVNEALAITTTSISGAWGDDGGSQYDVSVTNDVSADDFFQVINQLKSVGDNTAPDYNLLFNNCTTFSYNLVGDLLNLPSGIGAISFLGTGRNPADMCEDIRARASQYGSRFTSGNNIAAPLSTNCN